MTNSKGVNLVLSKKMGRPFTENPKDKLLQVRLDKETVDKLDFCVNVQNVSRSSVVRNGIDKVYKELKK